MRHKPKEDPPTPAFQCKVESMNPTSVSAWRAYVNRLIAFEISSVTRFSDEVIQLHPQENDTGILLQSIEAPFKKTSDHVPDQNENLEKRCVFLLNGSINHDTDIQRTLSDLHGRLSRNSRLAVVAYNPYLQWLYRWANRLGLRKGSLPTTFLTQTDFTNLARLAGYRVVRCRRVAYFPWPLLGLGNWFNAVLPVIPGLRNLCFAMVFILRAAPRGASRTPSLSIVIPARNERGNIENAVKRLEYLPMDFEILFVEGNSNDQTWEEIQRVQMAYGARFQIRSYKQMGKGKADAVRVGFAQATKDLVTILDADLTMPPEKLIRFYNAYAEGLADFVNGTRLVYPMENEAMRFLNKLGNVFFAKALSFVLGCPLADSLCGTKLLSRADYRRVVAWRERFGDFDPFGDFELLFGMAELGLESIDIPIQYAARTYGSTNISRFRHGWMLLKMTWTGFFRIKLGKVRTL